MLDVDDKVNNDELKARRGAWEWPRVSVCASASHARVLVVCAPSGISGFATTTTATSTHILVSFPQRNSMSKSISVLPVR